MSGTTTTPGSGAGTTSEASVSAEDATSCEGAASGELCVVGVLMAVSVTVAVTVALGAPAQPVTAITTAASSIVDVFRFTNPPNMEFSLVALDHVSFFLQMATHAV